MKTLGMIEYMDPEDLAGKAGVDEKCMLLQVSELHRYFSIPGNSTQTPSKTPSSSAPVTAAPVQPKLPPRRAEQEVPFSVPAGLLPPSQKATEAMKAIQNAMNPPKPAKAPMTPPIEMLKQLMEPCEMPDPEPGQKSLQFLIDDLVKNQLVIA
ncbi:hypothetical protein TRFO_12906 [Tritrichomonas foetus]|uniref:Uncharacterized protein n=1 Tax=Tritrichomonas foetus TaxID=1144522 RepID=A0A1J4L166_9EUKA|nr:hypothetical protein TRFO_12906 [Tritrichomonas foetus]|eukprot:OHT16824.1 hypothetical protein TRFO_12906 [Tritrichomonas foetus]